MGVRRSLQLYAVAWLALCVVGCTTDPEIAKRKYLESGDQYVAQGKLKDAIVQYRNAIQRDPRFGEARYKLAEALAKTDDAQGAFREYIRAADLLPASLDAQLKAGTVNLVARRFEDARQRADKALALNPASVDAHILRGNALAGLKDFDAAVAQVDQAIKADPQRSLTYADLGYIQLASGNPEKAEQAFKQALTLGPKSLTVHLALANFYWASGKREQAEGTLKDALAIEPRNVTVNRALAYLYMALNRRSEAEAPLKLVADETKDPTARVLLAELYRTTGRVPLALQVLDALAAEPKAMALARARKAAILSAAGRKPEAYAAVDEVLVKEPKNTIALLARAELLVSDGKLDEGLKLAQAAAADPSSVDARFAVGRIQAARGEMEEATKAYNDALKLAPRFIAAKLELAKVSLITNRPKDALRFADDVLAAQPRSADATLVKARALMVQGNTAAAEGPMKLLAAAFPGSPDVQAQLGAMYLLKKDVRAAREAYERALKIDTGNVAALTGLTRLDVAEKKGAAARARIDAALAQHRDSPPLLLLAARTDATLGDRAGAERMLRQAIEVAPSDLVAYSLLGQLLAADRRIDEAIAEYEKIAKRKPKSVSAHTMIGMLLDIQGKRQEAKQRYEQALGVDSRAAVAANNLAMVYLDTGGNPDVALQLAQTAKSQLPDNPDVNDTLGWAYYRKGLYARAIPPLRECVAKNPQNPRNLAHLGLAYAKNRQFSEAQEILKRALAGGQNFPDAKEAGDAFAALSASKPVS